MSGCCGGSPRFPFKTKTLRPPPPSSSSMMALNNSQMGPFLEIASPKVMSCFWVSLHSMTGVEGLPSSIQDISIGPSQLQSFPHCQLKPLFQVHIMVQLLSLSNQVSLLRPVLSPLPEYKSQLRVCVPGNSTSGCGRTTAPDGRSGHNGEAYRVWLKMGFYGWLE